MIFGLKRCGHEATEKRTAKIINCHYPDISWNSRCLFLWKFSHKTFPLFNRLSTFDKNVNLSKINPETEKFFLVLPSLNTSIFTTYLKIASTLRPFRKAWLKSQFSKWKSFQTFSITTNKSFYPNNSREKDNLIRNYSNLLKIRFRKRTHVFDNTMIS